MKKENGAMIVEASLIFPLVIFTVMALIYLGMFELQESAILYQVQKVTRQTDYVVASPGYQQLGILNAKSFDFAENPSESQVKKYYQSYHPDKDFKVLYREIFGATWASDEKISEYAKSVIQSLYFFVGFNAMESTVEIDRNFLSSTITTTTYMKYPMPKVIEALGLDGEILLRQGATVTSMNPADFVRDVDMAWDGIKALAKIMNIDLDKYAGKFKEIVTFL